MKTVTIPARPAYSREPEGIPFVLTPAERSRAALYQAQLERMRRERNRHDEARRMRAEVARLQAVQS